MRVYVCHSLRCGKIFKVENLPDFGYLNNYYLLILFWSIGSLSEGHTIYLRKHVKLEMETTSPTYKSCTLSSQPSPLPLARPVNSGLTMYMVCPHDLWGPQNKRGKGQIQSCIDLWQSPSQWVLPLSAPLTFDQQGPHYFGHQPHHLLLSHVIQT